MKATETLFLSRLLFSFVLVFFRAGLTFQVEGSGIWDSLISHPGESQPISSSGGFSCPTIQTGRRNLRS